MVGPWTQNVGHHGDRRWRAITIVAAGLVVGLGMTLVGVAEKLGIILMAGVGVVQLVCVIPVFLEAKRKNYGGLMAGLVMGASLVFLVLPGCAILFALFRPDFR